MKKDTITYDDFSKLDIRVGKIMTAVPVERSDKLILLTVDLGDDYGTREILAGIAQSYTANDLIGKNLLFLANLEPKHMAGKISHGMMLAVDAQDKPYILDVDDELAVGLSVC